MVRTITIASGKGGTGKTTIAANLAIALADIGIKVCVLDADIEMANLELILGMENKRITLLDVLADRADIKDAIYIGPKSVLVIPSGISLEKLRNVDPEKLKDAIKKIIDVAEIFIIDAPAGIGKDTLIAISSARECLLVVNPDISSLSDALKTKIIAQRLGSEIIGAVLNRVEETTGELTAQEVSTILEVPVMGVVPEDKNVRRAGIYGEPLILRYPNSPASVAIKKLARKLAGLPVEEEREKRSVISKLLSGLLRK